MGTRVNIEEKRESRVEKKGSILVNLASTGGWMVCTLAMKEST